MSLPRVRPDLEALGGYHSPQLDVKIRLNTNEAPSAPGPAFTAAVQERLTDIAWHRYPDRQVTALREGLAALHGVSPDQIFCANGSNEVLQTLLLTYGGAGRTVLTFEPTYAMHAHIAKITGATSVVGERTSTFEVDLDDASRLIDTHRPSVAFLCSPNNPTGTTETESNIRAMASKMAEVGGLLAVDEAYGQFAPWSALNMVDNETPLVVTRTFSKTWAMAGARLGYAVGPVAVIQEFDKVVLPYHLDAAKQATGLVALDFIDDADQRVAEIVEQRGYIAAQLLEMGAEVWPSGANFVLFRVMSGSSPTVEDGQRVWDGLVKRSVLVRNTAGWDRLEGCLRVTVGTPAENQSFLDALRDTLDELGASDAQRGSHT